MRAVNETLWKSSMNECKMDMEEASELLSFALQRARMELAIVKWANE